MTLLLAMVRPDYVVLLADRRITSGGELVSDAQTKLTILCCTDARVALAFTGLAKAGSFDVHSFIVDVISDAGATDGRFEAVVARLQEALRLELRRRSLDRHALTILMTGYFHGNASTRTICVELSNWDAGTESVIDFQLRCRHPAGTGRFVHLNGMTCAVSDAAIKELELMATRPIDRRHVVRKAVQILQRSAERREAARAIGHNCNTAIIEASVDTSITCTYHLRQAESEVHGPAVVIVGALTQSSVMMRGDQMLAGPEIRKREPCWCGSGLRFKGCHYRKFGSTYVNAQAFRKPLTWMCRFTVPDARPAGSFFCVAGGFA